MTGGYTEPKRFFEDSGLVDPKSSYHVELGPVTNTRGQDIRTMVDRGRCFPYLPLLLSFQNLKNVDVATFYHTIRRDLFQQS